MKPLVLCLFATLVASSANLALGQDGATSPRLLSRHRFAPSHPRSLAPYDQAEPAPINRSSPRVARRDPNGRPSAGNPRSEPPVPPPVPVSAPIPPPAAHYLEEESVVERYYGVASKTYSDPYSDPYSEADEPCEGCEFDACDVCDRQRESDACDSDACDVLDGSGSDGLEELQGVYFQVEALILRRERAARDQPLVVQGLAQTPLLTTDDLEFDWEVGPRAVAGFNLNDCYALELIYFGTHYWQTQSIVEGPGDLAIPGDLALATFDFLDADRMRVDYSAEVQSAEGNLVRRLGRIDFFGGFRFFSLDEQINLNAYDSGFGSGDYNIRISNDLYGGQIGARAVGEYDCWGWDMFCKAGAFSNSVEHRQRVDDFNNQINLRNVRTYESDVAFVGEAAARLSYYFNDRVSLRGGYHVLWADGVALAPNQFDFTDTATSGTAIDVESTLFMHGATLGLEVIW